MTGLSFPIATQSRIANLFQRLIAGIQPTSGETSSARGHAARIKTRIESSFNLKKSMIAGSFARQTYIRGYSDIDMFMLLSRDEARRGGSYMSSDTVLSNLKAELQQRFPATNIYRDVHAIVVFFSSSGISVDVVPVIFEGWIPMRPRYLMPDGSGWWMKTSPPTHNAYLVKANEKSAGKLRKTAQLIKFWRLCRTPQVPLSSFHIEMLLAANAVCVGVKSYAQCITETLQLLAERQCQGLRDPLGISGNIGATRSDSQRESALNSVIYSRDQAKAALSAAKEGDLEEAKRHWNIVFNDKFPRRYGIG
ncbi:MAG: nucleotidyltransferase [Bacteroidetes bacterium]|nr:nucleotidyltransferase [Bacteroidota bacterium]MCW5896716.1 nucleotidyltransferase [Bacteroidota bacterium]